MNDATNKTILTNGSIYNTGAIFKQLQSGIVMDNTDPNGLGRVKVSIQGNGSVGGDNNTAVDDLPYAFPLLPKHLSVVPKVGDTVWIFVFDKNTQFADRLYIGPIVSQLDKLNGEDAKTSALRGFSFSPTTPKINIDTIPQLKGVFPSNEDISIQGRYNTDITQKINEIVLRAGKFELSPISPQNPYNFQFNSTTQAYIQIKNDVILLKPTQTVAGETGSITNIVANKINLLTHKDGSPRFSLTGQDALISDDEFINILETAHQLAFGDIQLEYLKLLKDAFLNHVHNGNGNSPTDLVSAGNKLAVAVFKNKAEELEKAMLSKNIRIN